MMNWLSGIAALPVLAGLCLAVPAFAAQAPTATVATGMLSGMRAGPVDAFLGIPYAAPPVGKNRWRAPQPAAPWSGVRAADRFGASCYQMVAPKGFGPWTHEYVVAGQVSESCLFLNVWTPERRGGRLPVMVWIHGGGFLAGSGSVPIYDGARLAARGIVVVSINYRLGVFGFFVDPALAAEAAQAHEPPGNFGLQDMIAALKWVRRNIEAFGGDPRAVTIAGQSAGSIAVHELIASPLAAGLFERAIAESGFPSTAPTPSLQEAEKVGEAFARSKGPESLAALRALPPNRLMPAMPPKGPWFGPIVDGVLLPASPAGLLATGKVADTPILLGMNAGDSTGFTPQAGPVSQQVWSAFLRGTFGAMGPKFSRLYPASTDAQRSRAMQDVRRDLGLGALYGWARQRLAHEQSSVYAYLWTHVEPGPESARWGAFHSSEIPYVFETLDTAPERHFTALDREISRNMSQYWVDFIKTGDPNGAGLPIWPQLRLPNPRIMRLGSPMTSMALLPPNKITAMKAFIAQGGKPGLF